MSDTNNQSELRSAREESECAAPLRSSMAEAPTDQDVESDSSGYLHDSREATLQSANDAKINAMAASSMIISLDGASGADGISGLSGESWEGTVGTARDLSQVVDLTSKSGTLEDIQHHAVSLGTVTHNTGLASKTPAPPRSDQELSGSDLAQTGIDKSRSDVEPLPVSLLFAQGSMSPTTTAGVHATRNSRETAALIKAQRNAITGCVQAEFMEAHRMILDDKGKGKQKQGESDDMSCEDLDSRIGSVHTTARTSIECVYKYRDLIAKRNNLRGPSTTLERSSKQKIALGKATLRVAAALQEIDKAMETASDSEAWILEKLEQKGEGAARESLSIESIDDEGVKALFENDSVGSGFSSLAPALIRLQNLKAQVDQSGKDQSRNKQAGPSEVPVKPGKPHGRETGHHLFIFTGEPEYDVESPAAKECAEQVGERLSAMFPDGVDLNRMEEIIQRNGKNDVRCIVELYCREVFGS